MKSLIPFIRLMLKQWVWLSLGTALGLVTLLSGISLLSLSGWFIAASAFAGLHAVTAMAFNYFLPSGGVRFFSMTRIAGRYGERVFTHEATFKILTTLRVWIYKHLEPLAPAHLLRYSSGDLLNRLVSDVDAMDNLYIRVLTPTLLAVVVALIILFFLHFFNVTLAWVIFAFLVLSGVISPIVTGFLGKQPGVRIQLLISELRIKLVDLVQGMLELMLFNADEQHMQTMAKQSEALIHAQAKMAMIKGLAIALISLIMGITIWTSLYFGVQLVHGSILNGASLVLIVLAIMAAFEAVLPIPLAFQYLGKTITAAKRLLKIANTKPCVSFNSSSVSGTQNATIAFKQVDFSYDGRRPVLQDFNLTIQVGERVGLVGPTGIGKTTIVHLLSRSWDPKKGTISIGGVDIRELSETDLRETMTIISQQPYIFNATIRDNLLLAKPDATDDVLFKALQKVQLAEFVRGLADGLDTWAGEAGLRFSGGQIRRLAVARAILHDTPIWVLDEPTEGLDTITRSKMLEELGPLMAEKTVIIISHRLSDLKNMTRIVNLKIMSSMDKSK